MCFNGHKQEPVDEIRTIPDMLKDVPNYSLKTDFDMSNDKVDVVSAYDFWKLVFEMLERSKW